MNRGPTRTGLYLFVVVSVVLGLTTSAWVLGVSYGRGHPCPAPVGALR